MMYPVFLKSIQTKARVYFNILTFLQTAKNEEGILLTKNKKRKLTVRNGRHSPGAGWHGAMGRDGKPTRRTGAVN